MDNNGSLNTHLLIGSCEDENTENLGLRDGPKWRKKELLKELKKQLSLGGPLVMANLLQRCMQNVSVMFVGHLGELPLAGASLATSFANAVGFSVLVCPPPPLLAATFLGLSCSLNICNRGGQPHKQVG
ncbi:hypothetical protein AMTR_s00006p00092520 [Amborella trichopoda]|uniref:Uncharacterized protein n=1 Tax=Amborella trichopoda TaxID=13333 RepID=W1PEY9_AMBTC|nr:hypothetical protein AMTR_s00006p00092520 [Amborella trichopoda]